LYRWSRGRITLTPKGANVLLLTTTGRRTGVRRTTPLIYTWDGADLLVVGSNWGERAEPAWLLNLRAEPVAQVQLDGARFDVCAAEASESERATLWPVL